MNEDSAKVIAGLYPRVSTEDQSRFGHSLDEQEDRLKKLCEFKINLSGWDRTNHFLNT